MSWKLVLKNRFLTSLISPDHTSYHWHAVKSSCLKCSLLLNSYFDIVREFILLMNFCTVLVLHL